MLLYYRLLQDSLGGNTRSLFIVTLSPSSAYLDETLSTLQFADRAMKVRKQNINKDEVTMTKKMLMEKYQNDVSKLRNVIGVLLTRFGMNHLQGLEEMSELEIENLMANMVTEGDLDMNDSTTRFNSSKNLTSKITSANNTHNDIDVDRDISPDSERLRSGNHYQPHVDHIHHHYPQRLDISSFSASPSFSKSLSDVPSSYDRNLNKQYIDERNHHIYHTSTLRSDYEQISDYQQSNVNENYGQPLHYRKSVNSYPSVNLNLNLPRTSSPATMALNTPSYQPSMSSTLPIGDLNSKSLSFHRSHHSDMKYTVPDLSFMNSPHQTSPIRIENLNHSVKPLTSHIDVSKNLSTPESVSTDNLIKRDKYIGSLDSLSPATSSFMNLKPNYVSPTQSNHVNVSTGISSVNSNIGSFRRSFSSELSTDTNSLSSPYSKQSQDNSNTLNIADSRKASTISYNEFSELAEMNKNHTEISYPYRHSHDSAVNQHVDIQVTDCAVLRERNIISDYFENGINLSPSSVVNDTQPNLDLIQSSSHSAGVIDMQQDFKNNQENWSENYNTTTEYLYESSNLGSNVNVNESPELFKRDDNQFQEQEVELNDYDNINTGAIETLVDIINQLKDQVVSLENRIIELEQSKVNSQDFELMHDSIIQVSKISRKQY